MATTEASVCETVVDEAFQKIRKKYGLTEAPLTISVGPGWLPIVDEALRNLVKASWNRRLVEVKSKFCMLRMHLGDEEPLPPRIMKILREAEAKAAIACEKCGEPHGFAVPKLGLALCEVCWEKHRGSGRRLVEAPVRAMTVSRKSQGPGGAGPGDRSRPPRAGAR